MNQIENLTLHFSALDCKYRTNIDVKVILVCVRLLDNLSDHFSMVLRAIARLS